MSQEEKSALFLHHIQSGTSVAYQEESDSPDFSRIALPGQDLQQADLAGAKLQYSNFSKTKLHRAELFKADLVGVNFSNADLSSSVLVGADLSGATLTKTDLAGADLRNACLQQAYLKQANLLSVDLDGADLTGANLEGAHLKHLRSLPSKVRGCRLNAETVKNGLGLATLVRWHQMGAVIVDLEALPPEAASALRGVNEGLTLYFGSHLSNIDRFLVDAVVAAFTEGEPGSDCRLAEYFELDGSSRVRLTASDPDHLVAIAEALHTRAWDKENNAQDTEKSTALIQQVQAFVQPAVLPRLSWLVDRGERFELWTNDEGIAKKTKEWKVEVSKQELLADLLSVLFSVEEFLRFIQSLPSGGRVTRMATNNGVFDTLLDTSIGALERLGGLDEVFFLRLARKRPHQHTEIAYVAKRWGLEIPPTLILEG